MSGSRAQCTCRPARAGRPAGRASVRSSSVPHSAISNLASVIRQMSTMVMLSRRALLLSALLCGVFCSSSAFTVRSGADISQILSPERQQQKCQSFSNRSSLDISKAGRGVALSVASGGAAASSDDGPSRIDKIRAFTSKNFFLLGMMVAVALARAFPHVSRLFLSNTSRYRGSNLSHK